MKDIQDGRNFRPVDDAVTFEGQRRYQEDVSLDAVKLVTKMTYRDAVTEGELFTMMPSSSTIIRHVIEYGEELEQFNREHAEDCEVACLQADATNAHSQEADQAYNS